MLLAALIRDYICPGVHDSASFLFGEYISFSALFLWHIAPLLTSRMRAALLSGCKG